ncbi:MAG: response regulator transcription factor [Actinomycetota bacterium]|nr:response regulator transcription factor [Actinomycetota bacterium]
METVLVVDDEPAVRELVAAVFRSAGFSVRCSPTAASALESLAADPLDLIILDLTLPDMDGLAVLREIRQRSGVPIIVLTGRGAEPDRVLDFAVGADDYVPKPFSPRELVARSRSILRRVGGTHSAPPPARLGSDGLLIEVGTRRVLLAGKEVELTRREFDLLAFLARNPDQTFSRQELLEQVWESSNTWQEATTVTEHIRRLRVKLEADHEHPRWLLTVRGVGYRFQP